MEGDFSVFVLYLLSDNPGIFVFAIGPLLAVKKFVKCFSSDGSRHVRSAYRNDEAEIDAVNNENSICHFEFGHSKRRIAGGTWVAAAAAKTVGADYST